MYRNNFLRRALAAPKFSDEDWARRAELLNTILWGTLALAILYTLVALIAIPQPATRVITMAILTVTTLVSQAMLRSGRIAAAALAWSSLIWGIVTLVALYSGGVRTPAYASYTVIVVFAGFLLGLRAGLTFAGLSALAGFVLLQLQVSGRLPTATIPTTPFTMWAGLAMNFLMAPLLVYLALHSTNRVLRQVHQSREALKESNLALEAHARALETHGTALQRISRAYQLLSECNHAVVRASQESDVLQAVCDRLIEVGGYRLAWAGYAKEDPAQPIRPVAQHGFDDGYLEGIHITWDESPSGLGPTGTAIRTGQPVIMRSTATDPTYAPWREQADQRGYRSSVALPLKSNGRTYGALNVYASEEDAFDQTEVTLLMELAQDLSYGIQALRTRHALEESETRYRHLAEVSPDAIWIHASGKLVFANPAAVRLLGADSPVQLVGRPIQDFIDPEEWPSAQERIRRMLAGEDKLYPIESHYVRLDGQQVPVEVTAAPLALQEEGPAVLVIARDITSRLKSEADLRESEERYRTLVEYAADGIFITDPQGHYIDINPRGYEMLGYEREELIGRHFSELVVPDDQGELPLQLDTLGADTLMMAEQTLVRKDGSRLPVEISARMLSDGRFQGIVRDISERRRLDQEIQRRFDELGAIHQAGKKLLLVRTPEKLGDEIISILEDTLDYDHGAVLLIDPGSDRLIPYALSHQGRGVAFAEGDKAWLSSQDLLLGHGIIGWVAQSGESIRIGDVEQDPRYIPSREGISSELCVPLRASDRILGVINVESMEPEAFSEADQAVLETVAAQMTIAIQNAQLYSSLREQSRRLRALARRLAEVEEAQRRELAQELHDQVGQTLTALSINLHAARGLIPPEAGVQVVSRLEESQILVEQAAERIRDVMAELRPPVLDDYGLLAALRWLSNQVTQRTGLMVTVKCEETTLRLPENVETAFFRIAQEALNNAVKYAHATQAIVTLDTRRSQTRMSIVDDGQGFDPGGNIRSSGWGLTIMRERAESIGGHLEVDSTPAQGTRILVLLEKEA